MNENLLEKLEHASLKLADPDADDASAAYWWTEVGTLAVTGLRETGVTVVDETRTEDEPEEPIALPYGWASTPGEVEQWADKFGIPFAWRSGKLVAEFDADPGADVRAIMKESGFRGRKYGRGKSKEVTWTHGCFGSWPNSKSGKCAAYRRAIDQGETPEQARAASDECKRAVPTDDVVQASGGDWG